MVVVTLAFLGMIVLLQFVKTGMPKFQLWKRLIPAGACCIVLVLFVNLLQDEDFQTGHRLYPFLFTPAFMTPGKWSGSDVCNGSRIYDCRKTGRL